MLKGENFIQQEAVMWFNNTYCLKSHNPRYIIFSVPNESESAWETQKKVNTGLLRGASDLIVLMPSKAIFLECKTDIGIQSEYQKVFQQRVEGLGFNYHIFRSLSDFQKIINRYL